MAAKRRSRCPYCSKLFSPDRRTVATQFTCGGDDCQKERKRVWQEEKRNSDPDYRLNDTVLDEAAKAKKAAYMRDYRKKKAKPRAGEAGEACQNTSKKMTEHLEIEMELVSCNQEPATFGQVLATTDPEKHGEDRETALTLLLRTRLKKSWSHALHGKTVVIKPSEKHEIEVRLRTHHHRN